MEGKSPRWPLRLLCNLGISKRDVFFLGKVPPSKKEGSGRKGRLSGSLLGIGYLLSDNRINDCEGFNIYWSLFPAWVYLLSSTIQWIWARRSIFVMNTQHLLVDSKGLSRAYYSNALAVLQDPFFPNISGEGGKTGLLKVRKGRFLPGIPRIIHQIWFESISSKVSVEPVELKSSCFLSTASEQD